MADRPQDIENMAVSSDASASQHNLKDNDKDENDLRGTQSNPKMDAPKKKTTFKITSVTKSSQRGGSGDLTQDNDLDSQDDLDETVDSHTEDLSSEIYDTNSKATDLDNQDQLSPEEIKDSEPKEKPARFKVVKVETKEPFKRGRWMCYDYLDTPEKSDNKQEEINVNSGSSSANNSVHYVHGVDDPSKNPLLAGASGTLSSLQQPAPGDLSSGNVQGEALQQPASSSQPGLTPVSQSNSSFPNHVAMSSVPAPYDAQVVVTGQTMGQSMMPVGAVTNIHQGQTLKGGSVSGNVSYPSSQSQPLPASQGPSTPANVHSKQPVSVPGSVVTASQPMPPGAMQAGLNSMGQEYLNSMGQGQVIVVPGQQGLPPQPSGSHDLSQQSTYDMSQQSTYDMSQQSAYDLPQQSAYDMSQQSAYDMSQQSAYDLAQQSAYGINNPGVAALCPTQNHPSTLQSQHQDGFASDMDIQHLSGTNLQGKMGVLHADGEDSNPTLGAGLAPLEIAVGGITSTVTEEEITEEAGSSTVAIDNKIEQAMDLVKSHLMYAVREEVEVLKEQIKELMERLQKLEQENKVLRSEATPETLSKLPAPLPPIQNPLLQQLMTLHNPTSSTSTS